MRSIRSLSLSKGLGRSDRTLRQAQGTGRAQGTKPKWGDDSGMTLIELVVAMGISTILGVMTLLVFLSLNSAAAATNERSLTASQARVVLDSWNRMLQVAESPIRNTDEFPAFEKISANEIIFYASIDNRAGDSVYTLPTRVRFAEVVSDGESQLIEEQFAPTGAGWSATPTTHRVLADDATVTFTPVGSTSEPVGAGVKGCLEAGTPVAGLCATAPCLGAADCPGTPAADGILVGVSSVRITITITDRNREVHSYSLSSDDAKSGGFA